MADALITAEDLVAGLHDIRLPSHAAGGVVADVAAAAGLGLIAALFIALLVPLVSVRLASARSEVLKDQIAALEGLSPEERGVALLRMIAARNPGSSVLSGDLYTRDGLPSVEALEAELTGGGHV